MVLLSVRYALCKIDYHKNDSIIEKSKHIIVAVSNDLVTDQRVARTCGTLHEAGYHVTLIGRQLDNITPLQRPYRTVRMRLLFRRKAFFYAELNLRLLWRLLWSKADLIYANDTDTLPACYIAARLRHKPLFFDAHELFPEVPELVNRPHVRQVWQRIEDHIIPRIGRRVRGSCVTVTQSIADYYQARHGAEMGVVRNVPEMQTHSEPAPSFDLQGRRMLLYQGAVNVGRCVDWLIDAMEFLPNCHLVIAGDGDVRKELEANAATLPWHDHITFAGRLSPAQLRALTPQAALGFVLMENLGLSYYYSLPNRVGDYIQAGVPMVASDFPELRRIISTYHVGTLVDMDEPNNAQQLADYITQTLRQWDELPESERQQRFSAAAADLSWQNDKKVLLQRVETII